MRRAEVAGENHALACAGVVLDLLLKLVNEPAHTWDESAVDGFVKVGFFVAGKNRRMQGDKFVGGVNIPHQVN